MLSELESRGLNGTANAVAQSVDHIRSFFQMLRAELGFYIGCLDLRERLLAKGEPVCFPVPASLATGHADQASLSARGLYDVCLALSIDSPTVGNDLLVREPLPTSYGEDVYHEVFGAAHRA
jgi:hypothetical protein